MRCTYLVGNNLQWFISLFQAGGHVQKSHFCSLFFHINLRSVGDSRQLHFLLFAYSGGQKPLLRFTDGCSTVPAAGAHYWHFTRLLHWCTAPKYVLQRYVLKIQLPTSSKTDDTWTHHRTGVTHDNNVCAFLKISFKYTGIFFYMQ